MAPLIRAEKLTKVYGAETAAPVTALHEVSLQIKRGAFSGIVGPSGSGKSTLLNLLGCLDRPSSGKYWLDGRETDKLPDDELSRLRASAMGFVFQSFNLLPRLSVAENVALPLAYQGVPRRERIRRAEEMAARLGLGDRLHHRPAELSGGQAQRVGIARALVTSPRVVFADEPTGNLDTKTAGEILGVLADLHRDGLTVVMVTHDENIVQASDRVIHIIDGRIARDTAAAGEQNDAME